MVEVVLLNSSHSECPLLIPAMKPVDTARISRHNGQLDVIFTIQIEHFWDVTTFFPLPIQIVFLLKKEAG